MNSEMLHTEIMHKEVVLLLIHLLEIGKEQEEAANEDYRLAAEQNQVLKQAE